MQISPRFGEYGRLMYDDEHRATPVCNPKQDGTVYPLLTRTVPDELEITQQMNQRLGAIEQTNAQMLEAIRTGFAQLNDTLNRRFNLM